MRFASLAIPLALAVPTPLVAQTPVGTVVQPATAKNSENRALRFSTQAPAQGALVLPMTSATLPAFSGVELDSAARASIQRAIAAAAFKGGAKEALTLRGIGSWSSIMLVGVGALPDAETRRVAWRNAGGRSAQALAGELGPITVALPSGASSASELAETALGFALGQYRFDRYKSDRTAPTREAVTFVGPDAQAVEAQWRTQLAAQAEGTILARDLSTEPGNVIYPETFVESVRATFSGVPGVTIDVLDEGAMRKLNMGAILGVGQGSPRPPRMMIISYRGPGAPAAPLALVGKGITFNTGGLSLKPGTGMWNMKRDMSGAASVVGTVLSLAKSRAPVHVVAIAALAENMPDGNAQRPGDVVRTMSGKTIEMLNADAEGRLVLADAVEYAVDRFKPSAVITIATLTGAVATALNDEYAGLFSRDDRLIDTIKGASIPADEAVWQLPLHENYAEDLRSPIADIRNIAPGGGPGGGLGAHFVGHFVGAATPWAHLDIAGVAWSDTAGAVTPRGSTAWGVRLMDELARRWK